MSERITDERLAELVSYYDALGDAGYADLLSALRELASLREQTRWRPMEEAPKDGTHVLAFFPDWQCELWLERATIYEYEAGLPREEAERRAWVEVMGDQS